MNKIIKVLHTEWSDGWGGQEIRILSESKAFIEKGYEMIIAAQPNGELFKQSNQAEVPTIALKMNKGLNLFSIFHLVRYIPRSHTQYFHTYGWIHHKSK